MKVEVKDEVFQPVVITIETQEELDAVYEALGFFMNRGEQEGFSMGELKVVRELYVALP